MKHKRALDLIAQEIRIQDANRKRYDGDQADFAGYSDQCRQAIASLQASAQLLEKDNDLPRRTAAPAGQKG